MYWGNYNFVISKILVLICWSVLYIINLFNYIVLFFFEVCSFGWVELIWVFIFGEIFRLLLFVFYLKRWLENEMKYDVIK